jgi:serine phosphatase RsbU (regulator of sigma subunit)
MLPPVQPPNSSRQSLRTRYQWAGMITCLVSVFMVSAISYLVSARITADLSDARIRELTASQAKEFDTWFAIKEMIISSMAQDIEAIGDFNDANLIKLVRNKMRLYATEVQDFYVGFTDRAGHVISGVDWIPPADYDQRTRPWFTAAAQSERTIFTDPYVDAMTGELVITIAKALRQNGQLVAVLATDIFIGEIIRLVNSLHISEGSYAMLLNGRGQIIAHPDAAFQPTPAGLKSAADLPWPAMATLVDILLHRDFSHKIALPGPNGETEFFMFSQMHKTNWFFGIAIAQAQYEKPLRLLLLGFCVACVLSVAVGVLIMRRLVEGMIRPISQLTHAVETFATNDFTARATIVSNDELGRLGASFNAMADIIAAHSQTLENKVEERTRELQAKNTLIMNSIAYARRLQLAILPDLNQYPGCDANRSFAIWLPRDTVGGDMYWCRGDATATLLVVADCTGHGVPGALMTMTLSSILDATVRELHWDSPARIMQQVHFRLRRVLRQDEAGSKINDGADVAMVLIAHESREITYCGAHLSLFVRDNHGVREIRGDKQSIGYTRNQQDIAFTDIVIPWTPGLRLYLTTDGLLDQHHMPGTIGMGKRGFMALLESMADQTMSAQALVIEKEITTKLSSVPQRDDICVLGLELPSISTTPGRSLG